MNDFNAAKILQKSGSFFHVMRRESPHKYEYIKSLGNDMVTAYSRYIAQSEQKRKTLIGIYEKLKDERKLYLFSRYLKDRGFYSHPHSFMTSIYTLIGRKADEPMTYSLFLKADEIVKEYEEFCYEHGIQC